MFSIGKFERNFKEVEDFQPKSKLANCALAQQANNDYLKIKSQDPVSIEDTMKFWDNMFSKKDMGE